MKDIGDKSGFLEEEERKSDPVSMLSTPRRRSDSEQHEEEDDDYDKDMEDGEDEEQDGQSEGDRDDSEDSDASEQRNRRPRINRKRYAIVDDEETESGTKVANPASPLASDSNRERKRKHRIVDDDDDDMVREGTATLLLCCDVFLTHMSSFRNRRVGKECQNWQRDRSRNRQRLQKGLRLELLLPRMTTTMTIKELSSFKTGQEGPPKRPQIASTLDLR